MSLTRGIVAAIVCFPAALTAGDGFSPDPDGWIRHWIVYGPIGWYRQGVLRPAIHDFTLEPIVGFDFIAERFGKEGRKTEANFLPGPGEEIETEFGAVVPDQVLREESGAGFNPGGKLSGIGWVSCTCYLNFDQVFNFQSGFGYLNLLPVTADVQNYLAYAYTYVENRTGRPLEVHISLGSDDGVEVLLGKVPAEPGVDFLTETFLHHASRGVGVDLFHSTGRDCVEEDGPAPDPVDPIFGGGVKFSETMRLETGLNLLLVKVLEEAGAHALNFRFRAAADPFPPILGDQIHIHLSPDVTAPDPPIFRRMDLSGDGRADIGDAIFLLAGYLFGGSGTLSCPDAADADDDGEIGLTDAVIILSHLFLQPTVATRGNFPYQCCGLDPTLDGLDRFASNSTDPHPDPALRDPGRGTCTYPEAACR